MQNKFLIQLSKTDLRVIQRNPKSFQPIDVARNVREREDRIGSIHSRRLNPLRHDASQHPTVGFVHVESAADVANSIVAGGVFGIEALTVGGCDVVFGFGEEVGLSSEERRWLSKTGELKINSNEHLRTL